MPDMTQEPWPGILASLGDRLVPIAIIVVVAIVVVRLSRPFVHGIVQALMDREAAEGTAQELSAVELAKRMATIDNLGVKVIRFFVVVIAALMTLREVGLDIGPAIAGLGLVGIAVGFGAQHLVRDYLNGALILIENQFSKGDTVRVAGITGTVEDFSLRRTTLRDLDGTVHTIPNGEITVASNLTRVWARINEDVQVAYDSDIPTVVRIVEEVGKAMAEDPAWHRRVLEAPRVDRMQSFDESGVSLKVLGVVRAEDRWVAAGEFRRRLLTAFSAEGVEIPFPHRVIVDRRPGDPGRRVRSAAASGDDDGPGDAGREAAAGS